ncbi:TPA: DUF3987 domain-containing protein [Aeromonas hydrophila]|nr:DUF3987 domain-containing protein [Aeromonas hydrophila]
MNIRREIRKAIENLDEKIQAPLDDVCRATKAPDFMILTQMLSVMSIAAQSLVDISPPVGMQRPVSLYVFILAKSGERKSTVDNLLMKPFRHYERSLATKTEATYANYVIELELWELKQKALKKCLEKNHHDSTTFNEAAEEWRLHQLCKPIQPITRRVLIDDISGAKLKMMLSEKNSSLALTSDEGGTLLSSELIKDHSLFCSLWSGQTIRIDRANNTEILIDGARLTISIQVQPDIYKSFREKNGASFRSSGLDARFLFCEPASEIGYRFEDESVDGNQPFQDLDALRDFNARIDALLREGADCTTRHCLKMTDEAKRLWLQKHNQIEEHMKRGEYLRDYTDLGSKFMEQASRIAAVLHVFTHTDYQAHHVNYKTMDMAIRLTEIYLHQALKIFVKPEVKDMSDQKNADTLLAWIKQNWRNEWFLRSEIRRSGPYSMRNLGDLENAIEMLIATGDIYCFHKKQSLFISLSWDKYPDYIRYESRLEKDGRRIKGLVPYYGKYKSKKSLSVHLTRNLSDAFT